MIPLVSYALTTVAFGGLAALTSVRGRPTGPALYLLIACLATVAWSVSVVVAIATTDAITGREMVLETVRSAAWIAFLQRLLRGRSGAGTELLTGHTATGGLVLVSALLVAADIAIDLDSELAAWATSVATIGRIALAVCGLMLIENIARNDEANAYWWSKFAFAGLTSIFGYDLFLHSEALLFHRLDPDLYAARGVVDALAVPLFVMAFGRNPRWAIDVHLSRTFVFHTFTLIGSGSYLILMGLAGYY